MRVRLQTPLQSSILCLSPLDVFPQHSDFQKINLPSAQTHNLKQEQSQSCNHWHPRMRTRIGRLPSHPRYFLRRPGCFSCRSASTAELRHFGKTCELRMLDRIKRTCAAGLRHSVRPANCKGSPLTGFEVPNLGHPFAFLFPFFFVHTCRFRVIVLFFSKLAAREAFSSPKGGLQPQLFYFLFTLLHFYVLRLHSQPPALLPSLLFFPFSFSTSPMQSRGQAKKPVGYPQSGVCVCGEHLFAKVSRIHSYTFMQGAREILTQLAPTKLCVRWTGKRTCRSVPEVQLDWP